ncbi:LytR/AlgR family response regulator transcription factor [uncultured Fibrella sp.]|uniref:LytR/AlgR family response regulator transcription factor n=1 Tax=uncultured Fibrella sp. TaxID=1284596 RepID=UPI0035CA2375
MKLNCLIVDDEPMARGVIRTHLQRLDAFAVTGECPNAFEAINALQTLPIHVLFLDIQMPELSGLDLLRTLATPPAVVLTTAYSTYAVDSYEFDAVDYLLKPITFERFLKTTNRLLDRFRPHSPVPPVEALPTSFPAPKPEVFFLKSDKKIYKVDAADVRYVQGWGNYVKVFTVTQGMILTMQTLNDLEQSLPPLTFIRVHKSYIVNKHHIRYIEGNRIGFEEVEVPIGLTYRHRLTLLPG